MNFTNPFRIEHLVETLLKIVSGLQRSSLSSVTSLRAELLTGGAVGPVPAAGQKSRDSESHNCTIKTNEK